MKLIELLNSSERIIILFHIDTDGVCSAKITSEALRRLNKSVLDYFPTSPQLLKSPSFQKGIIKDDPDLIILVDVGLEKDEPILKNNPLRKFLVLDHHQAPIGSLGENVLYINPKLEGDETYTPASKICFDEFNKIVDISDLDWVSAAGIIGDTGGITNKVFIIKTLEKYGYKVKDDKDYFFDSFFGEISNLINSAKMCRGNDGAVKALKTLDDSGTPKEFYDNAYELREYNKTVNDYIEDTLLSFEKNKESYEDLDLLFFTFSPKYLTGSTLSTILSFKYPSKTIVIFAKRGTNVTVNFRRHDKLYDMGALSKESVKGLKDAGGGGHVPAAGAHLYAKDINIMKRRIISTLKQMKKLF